jgi:hypothetical protein
MAMAIRHGDEYFTRWTHVENGKVLNRRLHRIEIQARDGRLYIVTGEKLPDFLQTCSGHGYKGEHIAQILMHPKVGRSPDAEPKPWPTSRDALHAVLGLGLFLLLQFLGRVVGGA